MFGCHGGCGLGGQVVKFDRGNSRVEAADDLESDGGRVDVVHVQFVAQLLDPIEQTNFVSYQQIVLNDFVQLTRYFYNKKWCSFVPLFLS